MQATFANQPRLSIALLAAFMQLTRIKGAIVGKTRDKAGIHKPTLYLIFFVILVPLNAP